MATQTVEFAASTGLTLTAELFAAGSDTVIDSQSATEQTNRKGVYSVDYTDVAAGTYRLIALSGSTPVAQWWVVLTLTTATFQAYEVPDPATAAAIAALHSANVSPVERSTADTNAIMFSWPVSGATITGTVSKNNAAYAPVTGAFAFLRSESGKHYYTLAYNAADRPTAEGVARYLLVDGTYTRYMNLRVAASTLLPATQSQIDAILVDTNELQTNQGNWLTATGFATVNPDNAGIAAIQAKTDNLPTDPADQSAVEAAITAATSDVQTAILAKLPAALVSGRIDASVGAMATDVITAAALATDAVTEIQANLATEAYIAQILTTYVVEVF